MYRELERYYRKIFISPVLIFYYIYAFVLIILFYYLNLNIFSYLLFAFFLLFYFVCYYLFLLYKLNILKDFFKFELCFSIIKKYLSNNYKNKYNQFIRKLKKLGVDDANKLLILMNILN